MIVVILEPRIGIVVGLILPLNKIDSDIKIISLLTVLNIIDQKNEVEIYPILEVN